MINKTKRSTNAITVNHEQKTDLFEVLCANSHSKEACQKFVDKLEQKSQTSLKKSPRS